MPSFFGGIDWFLAYGNAEQSFFRRHNDLFDAITVPGTVATVFRQGTGGFVMALDMPYVIDPRTSIFQSDFDRGRLRTRHVKLAEMHGQAASEIMTRRALRVGDLDELLLRDMARSVVDFQRAYAATSSHKLDEYLTLLGDSPREPHAPRYILPPYFRFDDADDPWHRASLVTAVEALNYARSASVCPVVCLSERCLRAGDLDAVVASYAAHEFAGYFLWVSKLDQYRSSARDLAVFGRLVERFQRAGRPVVNLFGGYLSAILTHVGLAGISHGVGYGEARDAFYYRGGPPGDRYYLPMLHRFYPRENALVLLGRLGSLAQPCTCPACAQVTVPGDVAQEQAGRLDREGLLSHFLYTRRAELDHIAVTSLPDLRTELASTYGATYAIVSRAPEREVRASVDHLENWIQALDLLAG